MSSTKSCASETGASRSSRSKQVPLCSEIHTSTKRNKKELRRARRISNLQKFSPEKNNQGSLLSPRQSECGADCGQRR